MSTPSKLTMETTATILNLVRECVPVSTAARAAGISYTTLKTWRKLGEEDPAGPYGVFASALEEAVAHAEVELVRAVGLAAKSDARHAQWMLERRFQGRWSPSSKSRVEAKVEHSGSVDISKLTEAEADALQELVAKAGAGG